MVPGSVKVSNEERKIQSVGWAPGLGVHVTGKVGVVNPVLGRVWPAQHWGREVSRRGGN